MPFIHRRNIVIGDNASFHYKGWSGEFVLNMIRTTQAYYIRLPTYSPELNPSEKVFSFLKGKLKHCDIHNDLISEITSALRKIKYDNMLGWYSTCGYLYE